ncbi:MAG: tetratricopeptide repeat protein [Sedimentisphaerales bacterium]|nr:tetratricopeptide repeat protein [Sedimentisphaerales bacterium]
MKTRRVIQMLLIGCITLLATTSIAQPVSVQLREGRYQEEIKGDLEKAMEIYERIAFNAEADRPYIAEAYYRLGTCYLKKGQNAEAAQCFQTVVDKYSDQTRMRLRCEEELKKIGPTIEQTQDPAPTTDMDDIMRSRVEVFRFLAQQHRKAYATGSLRGNSLVYVVTEQFQLHSAGIGIVTNTTSQPMTGEVSVGNFGWSEFELVDENGISQQIRMVDRQSTSGGRYRMYWTLDKPISPGDSRLYFWLLEKGGQELSVDGGLYKLQMNNHYGNPVLENFFLVFPKSLTIHNPTADPILHQSIGTFEVYQWQRNVPANTTHEVTVLLGAEGEKEEESLDLSQVETPAPVVIATHPATYATDVDPATPRISVTFNQKMTDGNWSWVTWDAPFPETAGSVSFDTALRTCTLPVKLESGKAYLCGINIGKFSSFQNAEGATARSYAFVFATKDAAGNPTPIPDDLLARAKRVNDEVTAYIRQAARNAQAMQGGNVKELAVDDGKQAGKRSISGSGHAVRLESPADGCVLRGVRIYGSRYGSPQPPSENFYVWLCDEKFNILQTYPFPYSSFTRTDPRWVTLRVSPTTLPGTFVLCAGFNPERTKGVYVHYDGQGSGKSFTGLPGQEFRPFAEGEWMIRAIVSAPGTASQGTGARDTKAAEKYSTTGWQLWGQRKFAEAEQQFQIAVEKDDTYTAAWNGLGWSQFNQGKPVAAKEAFEKCIALDPKHSAALNGLGWIAKGQNNIDEALKYWKTAIAAQPGATAALNGLVTTYMEQKQYDQAQKYMQMWLRVEPDGQEAKVLQEKLKAAMQEN